MAKPLHSHLFLHLLRRCSISLPPRFVHLSRRKLIPFTCHASPYSSSSFTDTPFPYQYEMIVTSPVEKPPAPTRRRKPAALPNSQRGEPSESSELDFDEWVDKKLASKDYNGEPGMDKAKRKYYEKRRARMYGESDSEGEGGKGNESEFIELKQEVVELKSFHQRQEELYFYDAFALPSERNKHYKMVYQMEKKFFPNDGFDKAFLEPGQVNVSKGKKIASGEKVEEDKSLVFFEESEKEQKEVKMEDVTEKKVGDFFKSLKKSPNENRDVAAAEPFFSSRSLGLPPKWDGPNGTVVLVNKPKGWTSFTVCGKLRRLVQVKKVGHAGTLDPMATGLLIVCVGKATKVVDSYQGMVKGYSGIFRLGEATSTWDADSPVIQREPWEHIKDLDIKKAAAAFMGEISQVPPMFSAIKVNGQKMYDKARRGETVELAPRRISIFQFDVERSLDNRQNVLFRVTCSKGTYIRSLCADFGKSLGTCAHLTALRRDSIGEYSADDAWEFNELEDGITKGYM